jgi:hypothetical protein
MKTAVEQFTLALIRAKAIKPSATKDFVKANTDALAVEQEQINNAHYEGSENYRRQYYNETFKSEQCK